MRTSNIPKLEDLEPFVGNKSEAAIKFNVTTKTIVNWLKHYGLYKPKYDYNKLNLETAREIRAKSKSGASQKELASKYNVTVAAIGRILSNVTYHENTDKTEAIVSVIYNVTQASFSNSAVFGAADDQ